MNSKRWLSIAVLGCLVLLSSVSLFGQVTASASLQGTITDKTQAVIGNKAEVTVTNKETGASRTTKTNDAGDYLLHFDGLTWTTFNASEIKFGALEAASVGTRLQELLTQFLHEVAGPLRVCGAQQSVAEAARMLAGTGADAVAVVDGDSQLVGLITARTLLTWIADGGGNVARPVSELLTAAPPTVGPDATIADGVIAMGATRVGAVAMTTDGTSAGRLVSVVTARDLTPAFGDQPDVFGDGRVCRTSPLTIHDLVEIVRRRNVGGFH
jgi:CBS-domain-containing membrane protein